MKKKHVFITLGVLFLILCLSIFRPVYVPDDPKEMLVANGKVVGIFEGGINDVVFRLENNKTRFYINRGLEHGLVLEDLKKDLIGENITILYPKHWTLLDPKGTTKHMSILEHDGKQLYNEVEYFRSLKSES